MRLINKFHGTSYTTRLSAEEIENRVDLAQSGNPDLRETKRAIAWCARVKRALCCTDCRCSGLLGIRA
jgi:hypothetical protein